MLVHPREHQDFKFQRSGNFPKGSSLEIWSGLGLGSLRRKST